MFKISINLFEYTILIFILFIKASNRINMIWALDLKKNTSSENVTKKENVHNE